MGGGAHGSDLVLLEANVATLRRAGGPMLVALLLAQLEPSQEFNLAFLLLPVGELLGAYAAPAAGMLAVIYTRGSANFNVLVLQYGIMRETGLYGAGVSSTTS